MLRRRGEAQRTRVQQWGDLQIEIAAVSVPQFLAFISLFLFSCFPPLLISLYTMSLILLS